MTVVWGSMDAHGGGLRGVSSDVVDLNAWPGRCHIKKKERKKKIKE